MADWVRIPDGARLGEGDRLVAEAAGRRLALARAGGKLRAFDERCPHRGGPLSEGTLAGRLLTCPWHAWTFDLETGAHVVNPDAGVGLHAVREDGPDALVALEASPPPHGPYYRGTLPGP
ncbi:MAG TPA: Rieske 2Fe-2S domain-containing protein [Candidatus Thermoplasmatota archaeon]|nr:Rieske 2Fe-2S domain-containing protein [Candidatus Thermoplasmatota archaeon]